MNRCTVCDYTEAHGSQLLNTPPSSNNKVVFRGGKTQSYLCDDCNHVSRANLFALKTLPSEN